MLNSLDLKKFANLSATPAVFTLQGGQYVVQANATWGGGSVTLNRLSNDGTTYVSTGLVLSANGQTSGVLPSGTYQLAIATATGVYAEIISIVTTF